MVTISQVKWYTRVHHIIHKLHIYLEATKQRCLVKYMTSTIGLVDSAIKQELKSPVLMCRPRTVGWHFTTDYLNFSESSGICLSNAVSTSEAELARPINLVQSLFLELKFLVLLCKQMSSKIYYEEIM